MGSGGDRIARALAAVASLLASGPAAAADPPPPSADAAVVIESPAEGVFLATKTVHVEGRVPHPVDGTALRVNGATLAVTDGRFAADLPGPGLPAPDDGPFTVSATYAPAGSTPPPIERRVVLDRVRPVLKVTDPLESVVVFPSRRPPIRGRVLDANPGVVLVNGVRAASEPSKDGATFSAAVDLPETGDVKVVVEAVDAAGNRSDPVERTWRFEPPPKDPGALTLYAPHTNDVADSLSVRVKGRVARVIEGMTLRVNGVETPIRGVEFDAIATAAADGPFTIAVTYSGAGYAEAHGERKILVDSTPPAFAFTTFVEDETKTKEAVATVAGILTETNLKSARSVFRVGKTCEPRDFVPRKDGSFVVGVNLRAGEWVQVTFEATDKAGHRTEATKRIFYEPPGWDDLLTAMAAGKAEDWDKAAFFLQRALAAGLPRKLVPAWLARGVEAWLMPPVISFTSPAANDVYYLPKGGSVDVVVEGRVVTGRKDDVLWIGAERIKAGTGLFRTVLTFNQVGAKTIRVQVMYGTSMRASAARTITILPAPP